MTLRQVNCVLAIVLAISFAAGAERAWTFDCDTEGWVTGNQCTVVYADIGGGPLTECLKDVVERFVPYYTETIEPDLRAGKTVLIAAHGNSLRALVKHLDQMSDDDVVGLNIPTGIPLRYDLDSDLKPTVIGGEYLDPEAAAAGAAAVAAQGAK